MQDITTGIGVYTDAMLDLNKVVLPENIVNTGGTVVTPPEQTTTMEEGALGMERRATGYSQREVSRFNKAVDKIAAMINKVEGSDNPETKRQVQIILGQELGFDMDNLPQPQRSSYDEVDRTIIDFVAELGRQKANLNEPMSTSDIEKNLRELAPKGAGG